MTRIKVLGLGNVLMGDDALGPYVMRVLEAGFVAPEQVSILDAGTPGLDLIPFVSDAQTLIVVDAVRADGRPGELRLYRRAEAVVRHAAPRLGPHDPGLVEALSLLELLGLGPREVVLVGAIPGRVAIGVGLSPAVRAAVPGLLAAVVREVESRGVRMARRVPPAPADLWWEATVPAAEGPLRGSAPCTR